MPSLHEVDTTKFRQSTGTASLQDSFIAYAGSEASKINGLIRDYHAIPLGTDPIQMAAKIELLHQINDLRKNLDDNYPQILTLPTFKHEIQITLFNALKAQFAVCGIDTMHEKILTAHRQTIPIPSIDPFSKLLADMAPEKISAMLTALTRVPFDKTGFNQVFTSLEERAVADSYTIVPMKGHNSKNFSVTHNTDFTEPVRVLKVDNRLGNARNIDTYLRNTPLVNVLTPTNVSRTLTYSNRSRENTRTLLITEFCEGGDPMTYIEAQVNAQQITTDEARVHSALKLYDQMGVILTEIDKAGCFFPDMKNANWLIDAQGLMRIADTKSFVFAEMGVYTAHLQKNQWLDFSGLLTTRCLNPPELLSAYSFVDSVHCFMLGENLYQYLTGCDATDFDTKKDASQYAFDQYPIFQTPEGRALRVLIGKMVKFNPVDRITIQDALAELRNPLQALKAECTSFIIGIQQLNATHNQPNSPLLIQQEQELHRATALTTADDIRKTLNTLKTDAYKTICTALITETRMLLSPADKLHAMLDTLTMDLNNNVSYSEYESLIPDIRTALSTLQTQCTVYNTLISHINATQNPHNLNNKAYIAKLDDFNQHSQRLLDLELNERVDSAVFIQTCASKLDELNRIAKEVGACQSLIEKISTMTKPADLQRIEFTNKLNAAKNINELLDVKRELNQTDKLLSAQISHDALQAIHHEAMAKASMDNECNELITQIASYKIQSSDSLMDNFINIQRQAINQAPDLYTRERIKSILKHALEAVKTGKTIVDYAILLKNDTSLYKTGAKKKGDVIIKAMEAVAITQRGDIGKTDIKVTPAVAAVQCAIATRRGYLQNIMPSAPLDAVVTAPFIKMKKQLDAQAHRGNAPEANNDIQPIPTNRDKS